MPELAWKRRHLGELISLEYGASLPAYKRSGTAIPVYGSSGRVGSHSSALVDGPGIIVGRKGTVGAVVWSESSFWPIDTSYYAVANGSHMRWLFWLLKSLPLGSLDTSTGVPGLNRNDVYRIEVPEPPVPEQRKIAEALDTIDEAIRKTEEIIAKLKQVKQGLLHDLLTRGIDDNGELRDPDRHPEQFKDSPLGRIPSTWSVAALSDAADIIDPNPSHRYPDDVGEGVPIASTENFVNDDDFDLTWSKRVPNFVFDAQDRRCAFHPEDVVFARKGRIGFARPYGPDRKVFSHTVVLMKPRSHRMTHSFLLWSVRAPSFFDRIRGRMNFNVGVPTLGVGFLGAVPIGVPPIAEQIAVAQRLDAMAMRTRKERAVLHKLRLAKTGLMEDLLTGRVRVTPLLGEAAE